jgi:P27 family predicted phage terminase small subunit
MGRSAKSAELHELHGTVPQSKNGPAAFLGGRPRKAPAHLGPVGRKAYKRAVQLLENRRTLVPSDETTLELYAATYELWLQAREECAGPLMREVSVTDNNGTVRIVRKLNPAIKVLDSASAKLLALAKSLGLTQVDIGRTRRVADDTEKDGIVPGSVADLFPELLQPKKEIIPFVPLAPEGAEETDDAE